MMRLVAPLAGAFLALASPQALAQNASPTARLNERSIAVPPQLTPAQREQYRAIFADLHAQNWASAAGRLDGMQNGPLHDVARAELYTAPGSPHVDLEPVLTLLARAPSLPQATDLAHLATARGAASLPAYQQPQRLTGLPGQPRRLRLRTARSDATEIQLDGLIQPLIVADRPAEAEALLQGRSAQLSTIANAEFAQRIAWSYFLNANDADARRLAATARGAGSEWAVQAAWVYGLAAWRMGDCDPAAAAFLEVGSRSADQEFLAAGNYWAARADMRCGHPERVEMHLRAAARYEETFYGLLAQAALGTTALPGGPACALTAEDWAAIGSLPDVRAAVALTEIGETALATDFLKYQAELGQPSHHEALIHLAAVLNLTSAQMWLAHNGPRGAHFGIHDRYPAPTLHPPHGWRVDEALVYAHALQESGFRPEVVSGAGARGLMQLRPGTAGDVARNAGATVNTAQLNDPTLNVDLGQFYLQYLRDFGATGGLLPKVIAAYNAGPAPIADWNARERDQGDPLLYIEAIPYWETRAYVPTVLRNYWIYEERPADTSPSRRALAQGMWPRFPGMAGPEAVRIAIPPQQAAMRN